MVVDVLQAVDCFDTAAPIGRIEPRQIGYDYPITIFQPTKRNKIRRLPTEPKKAAVTIPTKCELETIIRAAREEVLAQDPSTIETT